MFETMILFELHMGAIYIYSQDYLVEAIMSSEIKINNIKFIKHIS